MKLITVLQEISLISRVSTPQLSLIYVLLLFKLSLKSHILLEFLPRNIKKDNFFSEFTFASITILLFFPKGSITPSYYF